MSDNFLLIAGGVGIVLLISAFFSLLASKEVNEFPLFTKKQKIVWLVILWCIPILGAIIVHKVIGLGWAKGDSSGGDGSVLPPESH